MGRSSVIKLTLEKQVSETNNGGDGKDRLVVVNLTRRVAHLRESVEIKANEV